MMIADRTDQDAFVIWDIVLTAGNTHSVKIMYALRNFLGQSLRRWHLRRDELLGKVWNLGGWESPSRWLRLGQLHVADVRSRLIVRNRE